MYSDSSGREMLLGRRKKRPREKMRKEAERRRE
jgi:hypothetical protein